MNFGKINKGLMAKLFQLYSCFSADQKKSLLGLQVIFIISAFLELAAVASIGPFMSAVANPNGAMLSILKENLNGTFSGLNNVEALVLLGAGVLVLLFTSSIVSIYTVWKLSLYSQKVGAALSARLFQYYMLRGSEAHNSENTSIMISNIVQETSRLRDLVIQPFMTMLAKTAVALVILSGLIFYDPFVGISGGALFILAYTFLYKFLKKNLSRSGDKITRINGQVIQNMNEAFGAYRELQLAGKRQEVVSLFSSKMQSLGFLKGNLHAVGQLPRYLMELIAFGALILLSIYLIWSNDGAQSDIVATLAIYALAGFKILPAIQNVYGSLVQVKSNISAFDALRKDLEKSVPVLTRSYPPEQKELTKPLKINQSFGLNNVSYKFHDNSSYVLNGISLKIFPGQSVGIVGPSGAGKSTVMDLLLGIVDPANGALMVDGVPMHQNTKQSWYENLGFVPQTIYLGDKSIRENIALGVEPSSIDDEQVLKVIELVELSDTVAKLDQGVFTVVGEQGVKFSGGQRQRIGLARALYREAPILFLDEATSGLDNITERLVMDKIHSFSGDKTLVIIAHRLSTIKACDIIFYLDNGRILDKGSYYDLLERNSEFRTMASVLK